MSKRLNSIAIAGGAFGDEGKGKIVDHVCSQMIQRFEKVIAYRWNGGSNAGHTVLLGNEKIILHQVPSGAVVKGVTAILGKGMVIHPGDLVLEINSIASKKPQILLDEMTPLALDTHRAYETVLKRWHTGGAGSTGRGIAPAYADIVYRHPIIAKDLMDKNWKNIVSKQYDFYKNIIDGLGTKMELLDINSLEGVIKMGTKAAFIKRLKEQKDFIGKYIRDVYTLMKDSWNSNVPFVFEGAQGVGLDPRWGVSPDVTASDPTFSGIFPSTQGIVDPDRIEIKTNVYKATYTSSVGTRILPTKMKEADANQIREDADEYGATTKRPRDIYHIDLPALTYFSKVSKPTHIVLTHMDISYKNKPIKVCVGYKDSSGNLVDYRPFQSFLDTVKPEYVNFKPWDGTKIKNITDYLKLPLSAKNYVAFISKKLGAKVLMLTTGPDRKAVINSNYLLL